MDDEARETLGREVIGLKTTPRSAALQRAPGLAIDYGYAAGRVLHAHRVGLGWQPRGRKIGFTNQSLWPRA